MNILRGIDMSNLNLNEKERKVSVSVDTNLYPLDVIYSAAYVFLDKAYILLSGDPKNKVIVELKPKAEYDLEILGGEFNNELLSYANYKEMSRANKDVRHTILQRALLTCDASYDAEEDDEQFDDPEGIAIPWEEKYGKKQ